MRGIFASGRPSELRRENLLYNYCLGGVVYTQAKIGTLISEPVMTKKAQKLMAELEKLPEEEQEELAASALERLRQRKEREKVSEEDPYSWLKVLRDAKLSGPEDASVTYEQKLYGQHSGNGE
jgi:hypothetical protein